MKIRVSNLPRVLYKDHYENKKDHYENKGVKPAHVLYKDHYENKGVKPVVFYIRTTMKIRVSNLPRVLYKDHYENKKDHYENKGVKPASCFI